MHTLAALQSGQLAGIKRLKLSENLTSFPLEILSLAASLEILDLSNNQLRDLPEELVQLTNLKIIFASDNLFEILPEVLGKCPSLEMVGFKSNQIKSVPNASLPPKLRWLILTNNQITTLPDNLGQRPRLQKLALAGNQLTELPHTLDNCHNLELIRISANRLSAFPEQLLDLPKLAWLAFAGNPFCQVNTSYEMHQNTSSDNAIPIVSSQDFTLHQVIGRGASGIISKASWRAPANTFTDDIAVKVFKGEVTSDGYPQDELDACLKAGKHINLVEPLAQVQEPNFQALIMRLIPNTFSNLGLPPSFDTCTRDTFPESFTLPIEKISKIVTQMQQVFEHLHERHICHGDLYAHNTLYDQNANVIFGDFGAASLYCGMEPEQQQKIKHIEARALRYFVDDLLSICRLEDINTAEYSSLQGFSSR